MHLISPNTFKAETEAENHHSCVSKSEKDDAIYIIIDEHACGSECLVYVSIINSSSHYSHLVEGISTDLLKFPLDTQYAHSSLTWVTRKQKAGDGASLTQRMKSFEEA
jgi:hypothetical protein